MHPDEQNQLVYKLVFKPLFTLVYTRVDWFSITVQYLIMYVACNTNTTTKVDVEVTKYLLLSLWLFFRLGNTKYYDLMENPENRGESIRVGTNRKGFYLQNKEAFYISVTSQWPD